MLIGAGIIGTLESFNIPTESILAGGAILGLAISFSSQSLVKDLVNGSLILLEDQFAVGDVVDIDGVMLIRLWIKTAPMQQWTVGREFRRRVRCAFDQHNIQIGRPEWISHNTGWHSPNGNGDAEATGTRA